MSPQVWPPQGPRILTGTVSGVTNFAWTSIAFPAGYFTAPPIVTCTSYEHDASPYIKAPGPTTAGFAVAASNRSTGTRVDWIAVQL